MLSIISRCVVDNSLLLAHKPPTEMSDKDHPVLVHHASTAVIGRNKNGHVTRHVSLDREIVRPVTMCHLASITRPPLGRCPSAGSDRGLHNPADGGHPILVA
ncbi:unnamed protein product [Danaus chrysippus]|uniref:(African queen) hypothetical protein n=1 Tax=Danaus chrysippus TaxID=151541 RepID=A0A8J2QKR3_9NEOP|nr:unnamed protein product [Danaus chrysippus]